MPPKSSQGRGGTPPPAIKFVDKCGGPPDDCATLQECGRYCLAHRKIKVYEFLAISPVPELRLKVEDGFWVIEGRKYPKDREHRLEKFEVELLEVNVSFRRFLEVTDEVKSRFDYLTPCSNTGVLFQQCDSLMVPVTRDDVIVLLESRVLTDPAHDVSLRILLQDIKHNKDWVVKNGVHISGREKPTPVYNPFIECINGDDTRPHITLEVGAHTVHLYLTSSSFRTKFRIDKHYDSFVATVEYNKAIVKYFGREAELPGFTTLKEVLKSLDLAIESLQEVAQHILSRRFTNETVSECAAALSKVVDSDKRQVAQLLMGGLPIERHLEPGHDPLPGINAYHGLVLITGLKEHVSANFKYADETPAARVVVRLLWDAAMGARAAIEKTKTIRTVQGIEITDKNDLAAGRGAQAFGVLLETGKCPVGSLRWCYHKTCTNPQCVFLHAKPGTVLARKVSEAKHLTGGVRGDLQGDAEIEGIHIKKDLSELIDDEGKDFVTRYLAGVEKRPPKWCRYVNHCYRRTCHFAHPAVEELAEEVRTRVGSQPPFDDRRVAEADLVPGVALKAFRAWKGDKINSPAPRWCEDSDCVLGSYCNNLHAWAGTATGDDLKASGQFAAVVELTACFPPWIAGDALGGMIFEINETCFHGTSKERATWCYKGCKTEDDVAANTCKQLHVYSDSERVPEVAKLLQSANVELRPFIERPPDMGDRDQFPSLSYHKGEAKMEGKGAKPRVFPTGPGGGAAQE